MHQYGEGCVLVCSSTRSIPNAHARGATSTGPNGFSSCLCLTVLTALTVWARLTPRSLPALSGKGLVGHGSKMSKESRHILYCLHPFL